VLALETPHVPVEDGHERHRAGRNDGGGAATAGEDGDLAEDLARPERADDGPVVHDVGGARGDRERSEPEVALLHQGRALLDVELLAHARDGCALVERQAREQRDSVELSLVHRRDASRVQVT
jgi:hypothetical protein